MSTSDSKKEPATSRASQNLPSPSQWVALPVSIRRIFDKFPLNTYDENRLPQRCPSQRDRNLLFVFTAGPRALESELSTNPSCLKWQAYLKFSNVPFSIIPSNNHASPSGSLPFLLPASSKHEPQPVPICANKISRWAATQGVKESTITMRHEAYMALIDNNIRHAWLYCLYLEEQNFHAVAAPFYINQTSSNAFVRMTVSRQLKAAAKDELLKSRTIIDPDVIYEAADRAFSSLNVLIGSENYFFQTSQPNLFDASVFAYTHPILRLATAGEHPGIGWEDATLADILRKYSGLVAHRDRLLTLCQHFKERG